MKVVIWFLCLLANVLVTVFLANAGILRGGIPTALLFWLTWTVANALCKQWDARCIYKKAEKQGVASIDIVLQTVPEQLVRECEYHRGDVPALEELLKKARSRGNINAAQQDILLDEFRHDSGTVYRYQAPKQEFPPQPTREEVPQPTQEDAPQPTQEEASQPPQEEVPPAVCFCRKCGASRIEDAPFCNRCGTAFCD